MAACQTWQASKWNSLGILLQHTHAFNRCSVCNCACVGPYTVGQPVAEVANGSASMSMWLAYSIRMHTYEPMDLPLVGTRLGTDWATWVVSGMTT